MSTGQKIHRRTVLRGLGVGLALPWLEAMRAESAWSSPGEVTPPKRLACLFMPNGINPHHWTPHGEGHDFSLSTSLKPLQPLQEDLLVFSNLWHRNSNWGDGHYVKTSGFLTGTTIHKTVGFELNCNGISLDQVVAQSYGSATPIPSMELGVEPISTGVDTNVGFTRLYGGHISWKGPKTPLAKEINPRLAFERLMRAHNPTPGRARHRRNLLDLVLEDARHLKRSLGENDRRKMDEYLESVHELERQTLQLSPDSSGGWQPRGTIHPGEAPSRELPSDHGKHVELMLDMIALAFQTDSTRVCSFMFGNSVSNANFSFLDGVDGSHHSVSHHSNEKQKLSEYQRITEWHVQQYARLLGRLKSMPEGDSSVLHNCLILFGSGLRDGNAHDPHDLPILLAGQAGGRITTGQHIASDRDTALANLYITILRALDVPVKQFADSTGVLPSILTG